jgi:predicted AAA+ superfamily ATPase
MKLIISADTPRGAPTGAWRLNELDRRRAETGYVKTADGLEVDFLVRNQYADHELIQVCANTDWRRQISVDLSSRSKHGLRKSSVERKQ